MTITIIVVRSTINGRWTYCPKAARHLLRPEQQEDAPFPTVKDALNAIRRNKTIPRDHEVEIENPSTGEIARLLDPFTCWPFPRSES